MSFDIKKLKPSATSRYKQGYIDPGSCKKLFPGLASQPIEYRSSYERKYIYYLETDPRVKYWGSECMSIPYLFIGDKKEHTYFPDFVVEMVNGDKYVVEIKPKCQCVRPATENGWLWDAYKRNMSKWSAAKRFCDDRGLKFKILTEETIKKL